MFRHTHVLTSAVVLFMGLAASAGNEIVKIEITEPHEMCARIACIKVAKGEAGIYNNPFVPRNLAYATTAEDTDIGGIPIPAGTYLSFQSPGSDDYDGMDFTARFTTHRSFSGITFPANSDVSFDRFQQIYDKVEKKLVMVKHGDGFVKVKGQPSSEVVVQNVAISKLLIFGTGIERLAGGTVSDVLLYAGVVSRKSEFPAEQPIHLSKGGFLRIFPKQQFPALTVSTYPKTVLEPEGYVVSSATYRLPTGRLSAAHLVEAAEIQGHSVQGDVMFHPNGMLAGFAPAYGIEQNIGGVYLDGHETYYGDIEMHDTGAPLIVVSTLVKKNAGLLPPEAVELLAENLVKTGGRIQYFFNPAGEIRALVIEEGYKVHPQKLGRVAYRVSDDFGLQFERLEKNDPLGKSLLDSIRGYVQPEVMKYLKTH